MNDAAAGPQKPIGVAELGMEAAGQGVVVAGVPAPPLRMKAFVMSVPSPTADGLMS